MRASLEKLNGRPSWKEYPMEKELAKITHDTIKLVRVTRNEQLKTGARQIFEIHFTC